MTLENKLKQNKLSWRQKVVRIGASVLFPIAGFLGSAKTAKADESNYLPADFLKSTQSTEVYESNYLPADFLRSTQSAEVYESNKLPADFNKDGIVDVRDMEAFGD